MGKISKKDVEKITGVKKQRSISVKKAVALVLSAIGATATVSYFANNFKLEPKNKDVDEKAVSYTETFSSVDKIDEELKEAGIVVEGTIEEETPEVEEVVVQEVAQEPAMRFEKTNEAVLANAEAVWAKYGLDNYPEIDKSMFNNFALACAFGTESDMGELEFSYALDYGNYLAGYDIRELANCLTPGAQVTEKYNTNFAGMVPELMPEQDAYDYLMAYEQPLSEYMNAVVAGHDSGLTGEQVAEQTRELYAGKMITEEQAAAMSAEEKMALAQDNDSLMSLGVGLVCEGYEHPKEAELTDFDKLNPVAAGWLANRVMNVDASLVMPYGLPASEELKESARKYNERCTNNYTAFDLDTFGTVTNLSVNPLLNEAILYSTYVAAPNDDVIGVVYSNHTMFENREYYRAGTLGSVQEVAFTIESDLNEEYNLKHGYEHNNNEPEVKTLG